MPRESAASRVFRRHDVVLRVARALGDPRVPHALAMRPDATEAELQLAVDVATHSLLLPSWAGCASAKHVVAIVERFARRVSNAIVRGESFWSMSLNDRMVSRCNLTREILMVVCDWRVIKCRLRWLGHSDRAFWSLVPPAKDQGAPVRNAFRGAEALMDRVWELISDTENEFKAGDDREWKPGEWKARGQLSRGMGATLRSVGIEAMQWGATAMGQELLRHGVAVGRQRKHKILLWAAITGLEEIADALPARARVFDAENARRFGVCGDDGKPLSTQRQLFGERIRTLREALSFRFDWSRICRWLAWTAEPFQRTEILVPRVLEEFALVALCWAISRPFPQRGSPRASGTSAPSACARDPAQPDEAKITVSVVRMVLIYVQSNAGELSDVFPKEVVSWSPPDRVVEAVRLLRPAGFGDALRMAGNFAAAMGNSEALLQIRTAFHREREENEELRGTRPMPPLNFAAKSGSADTLRVILDDPDAHFVLGKEESPVGTCDEGEGSDEGEHWGTRAERRGEAGRNEEEKVRFVKTEPACRLARQASTPAECGVELLRPERWARCPDVQSALHSSGAALVVKQAQMGDLRAVIFAVRELDPFVKWSDVVATGFENGGDFERWFVPPSDIAHVLQEADTVVASVAFVCLSDFLSMRKTGTALLIMGLWSAKPWVHIEGVLGKGKCRAALRTENFKFARPALEAVQRCLRDPHMRSGFGTRIESVIARARERGVPAGFGERLPLSQLLRTYE